MNANHRIVWLDIAKGIAICLMVLGHTSIPALLSNFIWAFHMPLFFIASGWTTNFDKDSWKSFLYKKARGLVIPFLVYSLVVILIQDAMGWKSILSLVLEGWGGYALWFIPVLYLALINARLTLLLSNSKVRLLIVGGVILLGCTLCHKHIILPWTFSAVPMASVFVLMGYYIKRYQGFIKNAGIIKLIVFVQVTAAVSLCCRLDMCANKVLPIIPIMMGAISGSLMVFIVSVKIQENSRLLLRIFSVVGKETFVVVAFSQIVIMLLNHFYPMPSILKYLVLMIALIVIVYLKNLINNMCKTKIL